MKYRYFLLFAFVLVGMYSCKKNNPAPAPSVTIVGKWQVTKQHSKLYNNGVVVDSVNKSKFTSSDFVEYYSDGSGYYSKSTPTGPSLSEFTYTISGTAIVQYGSVENAGFPETVTALTASSLAVHSVFKVSDPNDPAVTDTEIDDFSYTR
jgi:hypothetical protein